MLRRATTACMLAAAGAVLCSASVAQDQSRLAELQARAAEVAREVQRLEDKREIEILQRTYGYFVDKNLWSEIADLFTEDGTLEIGGRGVFVGKDRVQEYMEWLGEPQQGRLYDHTQMQGIVTVAPDGQTAKGRWRAFVFGGNVGGVSVFGDCIYENEYRKEDGVWKLSKEHSYFIMYTNWDQGWAELGWPNTRPEPDFPPDLPPTVVYDMYPGELTAPLHYENPVTGTPVFAEVETAGGASDDQSAEGSAARDVLAAEGNADRSGEAPASAAAAAEGNDDPSAEGSAVPSEEARATAAALAAELDALRTRLGLLEDAKAIERLHNIYGYYLDDRQWDELADLFAEDGTFELGQRGVYVGKARVRESLELLGEEGLQEGRIASHVQYQPVIHVAPDGLSARMRAREFVLSGEYGGEAFVGGSVYKNEYVKEDGVWKIRSSHPFTTFRADYVQGWAEGWLPMPGPSEELPPDRPPSVVYEAFPAFNLLPPFHYDHPVTGEPITR